MISVDPIAHGLRFQDKPLLPLPHPLPKEEKRRNRARPLLKSIAISSLRKKLTKENLIRATARDYAIPTMKHGAKEDRLTKCARKRKKRRSSAPKN
jgi:hypothetical protein